MFTLYSIALTAAFALMLPLFILRRQKYASGLKQRLGNYPEFDCDERPVIWLHCVSVGETNAARPLVDAIQKEFPSHRLVISTTTKTGQELAQKIFAGKADAVFYFPFDWKFSVRRALDNYRPSVVLLMETEIWPRFISEAKKSGAKVAIVNGRLSEKSFRRYSKVRAFVSRVLDDVDLALMQAEADAGRIAPLGINPDKVFVTGNLKFDLNATQAEFDETDYLRERFRFDGELPLIVAASTHDPEERWILESLDGELGTTCRLLIAPRHPERFDAVADYLKRYTDHKVVRRSAPELRTDKTADVVLLDSIGELRSVYPLADIVFVGGSLIPHGGQSILEPGAAGKAVVTGSHTHNFSEAVSTFLKNDALIQLPDLAAEEVADRLSKVLSGLLEDPDRRSALGSNAIQVMQANRGATERTVAQLRRLISRSS